MTAGVNTTAQARGAAKSAVCCVSSYDHLHHVLVLARSIRRHWREQPALLVLLMDHHDKARPGFEDVGDVLFLSPAEVAIPDFHWLALKFNAIELACACKPFVVAHALRSGYDTAWYVDSDMLFMADPSSMRELASAHDIVVTPHILAPMPDREAWTHPSMGVLAWSGYVNAGLFAVRRSEGVFRFLKDWSAMTTGSGAYMLDLGNTTEQQSFGWAPSLVHDVAVCRDRRLNVAYWNLHERPLRWAHLDGGPRDEWRLDGETICCFHFSGFTGEDGRLSKHDGRHRLDQNINLHHLTAHYEACLDDAGRDHYRAAGYGHAKIGDLALSDGLRRRVKWMERHETLRLDAWSDRGATELADRLMTAPGTCTLLPAPLEELYLRRPDLQALDPGEPLFPRNFLNWCRQFLEPACGDDVPLFHSSLLAVHRDMRAALVRECAGFLPGESPDRIAAALVHARPRLAAMLRGNEAADGLVARIEAGHHLAVATNPAIALRLMMQVWPAAFASVPPFGRSDIRVFRERVREAVAAHFEWPAAHAEFLDRLDPEVSLARVMSVIRRHPERLADLRRLGLGRELILSLVPCAGGQVDFDAADLALVDWYLDASAAGGAAPAWRQVVYEEIFDFVHQTPALHRLVHKTAARERLASRMAVRFLQAARPKASPLAQAVRRALKGRNGNGHLAPASRLPPLLADENDAKRWHGYLAWWAARNGLADGKQALDEEALASLDRQLGDDWRRPGDTHPSMAPAARGLNIFGYFKSPTGLGQQSRGLAAAHAANGNPHREIVLTNLAMTPDFRLEDLYPDFAFHFPRNLVVSYPHVHYDLRDIFPPRFFRGRENIVHLAWEQRDVHPEWCRRLDRYDRLLAVSTFAADAVARATGRDCRALPNVVQVDTARARGYRRGDFGLPADAFIAGIVFDASSSIARKNPLGAAQALARAFGGRRDVMVVIKAGNAGRPSFRRVLGEARSLLADAGISCRVLTHVMPREEVEGLMAQMNLYVSLHRSEGFGYSLAEAMWLGTPVVATGYSGNMDFMTEANSYPVRYRETVVSENDGPFQLGTVWAEPDLAHAAALCDQVYRDREDARARSAKAERDVRAAASVEAVAARLAEILGDGPAR